MSPAITAVLALTAAALATPAAAACDFRYPQAAGIVRHAVSQIGESVDTWDLDKPTVFIAGRAVKLLFELRDQDGKLDCPYLVVRIADCGRGKARARVEAWDVALDLRKD
ncbi:hypothetical protein LJR164_002681 [Phenylobacterium sp. LjRoot164]|uniref:hypothetical protein n=1 Tax=unclassified Phenylobacterium TaxID=2640670 RepID=UPI003ECD433B